MKSTFKVVVFSIGFGAMLLSAALAWGKSDKYARPGSSSSQSAASAGGKVDLKNPPPATAEGGTGSGSDKKVDLTDLESRYWTAKDTEFKVVQNRLYTKEKRFSITPIVGTNLSGQYSSSYNVGADISYYFTERTGVELTGWYSGSSDNDFVLDFAIGRGVMPDHNLPMYFVGANYNWVPIYAKMSFLEKKILYFDMFISPGIGVTGLKSRNFSTTVSNPPEVKQMAPTLALDVGQQVFFGENLALRLDLRNHMYQEKIYQASSGTELRTKFTYDAIFMLGVSFFFDAHKKEEIEKK